MSILPANNINREVALSSTPSVLLQVNTTAHKSVRYRLYSPVLRF